MQVRSCLILATALSVASQPFGLAAEICLNPRLQGYFEPLKRAESVLPRTTHSADKVAIYIEKNSNGYYYFHSNFIAENSDNPTKIAAEGAEAHDLLVVLSYILHPRQTELSDTAAVKATAKKATVFLDKSVLDVNGQPGIDLGRVDGMIKISAEGYSRIT